MTSLTNQYTYPLLSYLTLKNSPTHLKIFGFQFEKPTILKDHVFLKSFLCHQIPINLYKDRCQPNFVNILILLTHHLKKIFLDMTHKLISLLTAFPIHVECL